MPAKTFYSVVINQYSMCCSEVQSDVILITSTGTVPGRCGTCYQ